MSDIQDNDQDLIPTPEQQLETLKARADLLKIQYHPSIGLEKLQEKINAKLAETSEQAQESSKKEPEAPSAASPSVQAEIPEVEGQVVDVEETPMQRRDRKRKEANELVRIRVTCMNPAKREWEGEMFSAGNSLVGNVSKYVPFNNDEGWHVPRIIFNMIKDRECQVFVSKRDDRGNVTRQGKLIKEFAVEVMPDLTVEELHDLAQRQAMAGSIDR